MTAAMLARCPGITTLEASCHASRAPRGQIPGCLMPFSQGIKYYRRSRLRGNDGG
ncbi:hypothetical protein CO2235_MP90130 [Cupriavidus oxalaticus]|uniref:Uncharacterized protein n=1 Tax=Cupriavidus oxalaticus TaxID=96344 RepID=A0A976GDV8_9BURK|nr:hypothetical protein CO2235_MP90130 [Cupriavidus oxalaticus]